MSRQDHIMFFLIQYTIYVVRITDYYVDVAIHSFYASERHSYQSPFTVYFVTILFLLVILFYFSREGYFSFTIFNSTATGPTTLSRSYLNFIYCQLSKSSPPVTTSNEASITFVRASQISVCISRKEFRSPILNPTGLAPSVLLSHCTLHSCFV